MLAYDSTVNIFGFPGAIIQPLSPPDLISSVYFIPLARRLSQVPGVLVDSISFGSFRVAWDVRVRSFSSSYLYSMAAQKYDFLLYVVKVEL